MVVLNSSITGQNMTKTEDAHFSAFLLLSSTWFIPLTIWFGFATILLLIGLRFCFIYRHSLLENKRKELYLSIIVLLINFGVLLGTTIYLCVLFVNNVNWDKSSVLFKDWNDPICKDTFMISENKKSDFISKRNETRKCLQEKYIEVEPSLNNDHNVSLLVSLFSSNDSNVDLIYFKERRDFLQYSSTHWLDPTSVNYEMLNKVSSGFKIVSFGLKDSVDSTNGLKENNTICIVIRRTVDRNKSYLPLSFSVSTYLIYTNSGQSVHLFLTLSLLVFELIVVIFTMTRIQKLFHSEKLVEGLIPITLQRIFCMKIEKRTYNQSAEIMFTNLSLKKFDSTPILKSVTGVILPGRTTAVMGGSGSGKTSFITALCQRAFYALQEGEVTVNGQKINSEGMKRLIAFVPQDDIMLPNLTVSETLYFNAISRDLDWGTATKRVNDTLEMLKLSHKKNSIIGDVNRRGISGGEKKRVNVGIEVVVSPPILILDEPTSGLVSILRLMLLTIHKDSDSALVLCSSLQELSRKKDMNIICVIHQPSYEVFEKFDDVMLFKNGELIVHGSRQDISEKVSEFCQQNNIKQNLNPADTIIKMLDNDACCYFLSNNVEPPESKTDTNIDSIHVSPFYVQSLVCFIRSILQLFRDWFDLLTDIILNILGGLLIGIMYNDNVAYVGPPLKQTTLSCPPSLQSVCSLPLQDNIAPFTSLLVLGVALTSMMSSLKVFGKERINFERESQSGIISFVYFIVKDICALVNMTLGSVFFTLSCYYIAQPEESFSFYFSLLFKLSLATFPLGYIISILMPPQLSQVTSVVVVFIFYIFSGVTPTLPEINQMPFPIPIFPLFSFLRYIRELLYLGELQMYSKEYEINKSMQLQDYVFNNRTFYDGIIIVFIVVHRVIAYIVLWQHRPNSFSRSFIYYIKFKIGWFVGTTITSFTKLIGFSKSEESIEESKTLLRYD